MDQRAKDADGIRNEEIGQKHLGICSKLAKARNDFLGKVATLAFGLAELPSNELS